MAVCSNEGKTILGEKFAIAAGGKEANQAVAAARRGADVTFVTRLGRDWMGDQALENYRTHHNFASIRIPLYNSSVMMLK